MAALCRVLNVSRSGFYAWRQRQTQPPLRQQRLATLDQGIPFHQRLKRNTRVPNAWNRLLRLDELFRSLKPGECRHLPGRRPLWGCFVYLCALRLDEGEFLFIASSRAPQDEALAAYANRWEIEIYH